MLNDAFNLRSAGSKIFIMAGSTNNSQETIVKTKNAATTMATFHTRTNNFKIFKLQKGQ